jgi:hypothetical protein
MYIVEKWKNVKRKNSAGTVDEERRVGRRSLLTRGGVVLAGVVGATAGVAALSGKADAATGDPVLQGNVNTVTAGASATEIDANSGTAATPTLILSNSGSTGSGEATPTLRLTPAASTLTGPSSSTVGGDLVATGDGELWFTHQSGSTIVPATVHTDANSNSFVPLSAPVRILDTRSASLRKSILDPSGKLASSGQLLKGKTIHINLTSLVYFGDALSVNLTVTGTEAGGDAIVWPGGATPSASSINFAKGWTIANMIVSGIDQYSSTVTDSIAVTTTATTHVILDIAGFYVANFGQVNPSYSAFGGTDGSAASPSTSRAQQVRQAVRSGAIQAHW